MFLFLDDVRTPDSVGLPAGSCVLVRSVEEAQATVLKEARFERWCLDHDLGEDSPTGYDFLKWASEKALDKWPVGEVWVHSANPAGAENMRVFVRHVEKHLCNT